MNWTGGSLSRSRRQNANLSGIQKKHFARARGKLLNGRPPPHQIDIAIFQDIEHKDRTLGGKSSAHDTPRERQSSQMILEDFENVRPVVRQLQSIRPRHALATTLRSPGFESQGPSSSRKHHPTRLSQTKTLHSNCSHSSREANARATESVPRHSRTPSATDELEAKRRELLGIYDWVGLEKMKPVKMKFADAEDRDLIGKRRIVKSNQSTGEPVARISTHRRPVIHAYEKLNMMRASSNMLTSPEKVSIHIGSSPKGSVRRRNHNGSTHDIARHVSRPNEILFEDEAEARAALHHPVIMHGTSHHSTNTSEEMLLDHEWYDQASLQARKPSSTIRGFHQRPSHREVQTPPYSRHGQGIRSKLALKVSDARLGNVRVSGGLPATYTISSGSKSVHSSILQDVAQASDSDEPPRQITSDGTHFPPPRVDAVSRIANFVRLYPDDAFNGTRDFDPPKAKLLDGQKPWLDEERTPLYESQNVTNRQVDQLSYPRLIARLNNGHHTSEEIVQDFTNLSPAYKLSNGAPMPEYPHENSDIQRTEASSQKARRAENERRLYEEQPHPNEIYDATENLATHISNPPAQEKGSEAIAPQAATKSRLPALTEPPPIVEPSAPADPTREEEELLWRTFVFGTEDPAKDWTFEDPNVKSTIAQQQQNPLAVSSPSRILPPPVVFRKPSRYVGESRDAIATVRVLGGRKNGKRMSDEDETYGERKSRKGRDRDRAWDGVVQQGWDEVDEIVD
ncbi:MAG: hypothetical protein Q9186_000742 [Xanthomendoza sp. 1 TL-2023]